MLSYALYHRKVGQNTKCPDEQEKLLSTLLPLSKTKILFNIQTCRQFQLVSIQYILILYIEIQKTWL